MLKTLNAALYQDHVLAQTHEFKYGEISQAITKHVEFTVIHQQNSRSHDQCRKYIVIGSFYPMRNYQFHPNQICVIFICRYRP